MIVWNRIEDMTAELYDNVNDNEDLAAELLVKASLTRWKPRSGGESVFDAVKVLQKNGRIVWNRVEDMTAELYDNVNDNENLS